MRTHRIRQVWRQEQPEQVLEKRTGAALHRQEFSPREWQFQLPDQIINQPGSCVTYQGMLPKAQQGQLQHLPSGKGIVQVSASSPAQFQLQRELSELLGGDDHEAQQRAMVEPHRRRQVPLKCGVDLLQGLY